MATMVEPADQTTEPTSSLRPLLERAATGDQAALQEVTQLFETKPEAWTVLGDLGRQAERALVQVVAGEDHLYQHALERHLATLRTELAGPQASPLERLLVERIVASWLAVHHADLQAARLMERGGGSPAQATYHLTRQDRAQRRYLAAIRTLAQVRRLLGPTIQLNVAEQQINVAR